MVALYLFGSGERCFMLTFGVGDQFCFRHVFSLILC